MKDYNDETYGNSIAEKYDTWFSDLDPSMIDYLLEISAGGRALELGIGTGRVAIPLKEKGIEVHGIDSSTSMVDKMRLKPNGEDIPVTIQSFAKFVTTTQYDLVYVVFNTFFGLLTQEEQISCFKSVADTLKPGGCFVIEAFVPDLGRFDRGQSTRMSNIASDHVRLECSLHEAATQTILSQIVSIDSKGIEMYPIKVRYAWPSEIDLMAQLSGMKRISRWSDWKKSVFTNQSSRHVSTFCVG